jgi:hypothetical protein
VFGSGFIRFAAISENDIKFEYESRVMISLFNIHPRRAGLKGRPRRIPSGVKLKNKTGLDKSRGVCYTHYAVLIFLRFAGAMVGSVCGSGV